MIPEDFDPLAILNELNRLGFRDYKIEMACGFNHGYVAQIRCGNVKMPAYPNAAKLLNLLEREEAQGSLETLARRASR